MKKYLLLTVQSYCHFWLPCLLCPVWTSWRMTNTLATGPAWAGMMGHGYGYVWVGDDGYPIAPTCRTSSVSEEQEWIQKIRTCWPWSVLLCPYNARRGEVQRLHAYHMVIPQGGYIRAIERSLLPIVCPPRQDGSVAETKTVTEPSSCGEDGADLIPRYGGSQECRGARIGTS